MIYPRERGNFCLLRRMCGSLGVFSGTLFLETQKGVKNGVFAILEKHKIVDFSRRFLRFLNRQKSQTEIH